MKGYIQVYTGNGKGKTTAALGLALRAMGAGKKVLIAQFLKTGNYSEIKALSLLAPHITVKQFGAPKFVMKKPSPKDKQIAQKGWKNVETLIRSKKYDLVILDEINVAAFLGLIPVQQILFLMEEKPENLELVLTGRNASPKILEKADLVTDMREIKHYFSRGIKARMGIEK